jgi:MFS family permease
VWLPVLRNRDFRRLWTAATIDSFGSWLLVMAVPLHVFTLTRSAASTGLTLAVQAAPAVLIGPWAGVVIDRWHRRKVLVVANVASAAAVALMMLAATPGRLMFIYLGLTVENAVVCVLRPALGAVTPSIVGSEADLAAANSLWAFTNSAFRMLGPLVGTFLVACGWFQAVVLADVASYLAAAVIVGSVAIPRTARPARTVAARTPGGLRYGLRHVVRTPLLRGLLIISWAYWTVNAALTALLIPFVAIRLHSPGRSLGYLIAGLGIGYLCGSALSKVLISRYPTRILLAVAYASVGVCFLVMFTTTALPVAVIAVTAAGVPGAVVQIVTGYRLQTSSPDAVLGRVSAAFYTSDCVAAVAGALAAPAIVALIGLAAAVDLLSVMVLATAGMAVLLLPGAGAGRSETTTTAQATVP